MAMAAPNSADHRKRLVNLTALYDQGKLSECKKQCEQSLKVHAGMAPYWRIKTFCILVGANSDWQKAEKWRQAGESVYATLPRSENVRLEEAVPFMEDLRESLDDLYAYQAERAPSWFRAKEMLDRWVREEKELRQTPTPIGEDEDQDEDLVVEEQVAAQSDSMDDEAAGTVQEPAEVSKMKKGEAQPSAEAVDGAKKESLGSKIKDRMSEKVSRIVGKIQSTAVRLRSRASALGELPPTTQETNKYSEHRQRTEEAMQNEMDALDAEDAFQKAQLVARKTRRKVLREKSRK